MLRIMTFDMLLHLIIISQVSMLIVAIDNNAQIQQQPNSDPFYINETELLIPQNSSAQVNQSIKNHLILQAQQLLGEKESKQLNQNLQTRHARVEHNINGIGNNATNNNRNVSSKHISLNNDPFAEPNDLKIETTYNESRSSHYAFEHDSAENSTSPIATDESAHSFSIDLHIANSANGSNGIHELKSPGTSIYTALKGRQRNQTHGRGARRASSRTANNGRVAHQSGCCCGLALRQSSSKLFWAFPLIMLLGVLLVLYLFEWRRN